MIRDILFDIRNFFYMKSYRMYENEFRFFK